jgi:hypothetical protein
LDLIERYHARHDEHQAKSAAQTIRFLASREERADGTGGSEDGEENEHQKPDK